MAIKSVEEDGIVFMDEIDKIATSKDAMSKKSPSTDGVQRDLLPLIEGTNIVTNQGKVNTRHILFVCAGAFNISKPTDILPELLGRLPVTVRLQTLTKKEFKRILTEVKFGLIEQYTELLAADGIIVKFQECALDKIAEICEEVNHSKENLGARRLHELIEALLEDISYGDNLPEDKTIDIDAQFVEKRLTHLRDKQDYKKYLL